MKPDRFEELLSRVTAKPEGAVAQAPMQRQGAGPAPAFLGADPSGNYAGLPQAQQWSEQPVDNSFEAKLKRATAPPMLEGKERAAQDVRSAVITLGKGVAGTVSTGARAFLGAADIPVPVTAGEGNIKAEATRNASQATMAPFEAVAPAAPNKPYTPRVFEEGMAGAVGSSITFLGPGAAARMVGLGARGLQVTVGTLGASQSFGQKYVEAWEATKDEDKAFAAGLISAVGGATEAFGGEALALGKLMGTANRATAGALATILESGVENVGQEALQQVIDNIATQVYDGDQKLLDGVLQAAAIGGTIGALFGSAAAAAQRMRSGGATATEPAAATEAAQAQPVSIAQLATPVETAPLAPESVAHMDAIRADPKMAALPQAEKLVEVKPSIPEQVWAQEWLNQRGMKAVFVQDSDGKALPFRGVNYRDTVYMDASLPPTEIKRRVVYHEAVHSLPGPVVNDLLAVWRKVDPKGYASLEASVAAKYPTEQVGEEAAAHNAERLVDLIAEGEVDPTRLQKIINANPTLWQKFVQAIRTAAEKLGLATPDQQFPDAKVAVEYLKAFDELLKRPTVRQQWSPVAATQQAATPVVASQEAPAVTQEPAISHYPDFGIQGGTEAQRLGVTGDTRNIRDVPTPELEYKLQRALHYEGKSEAQVFSERGHGFVAAYNDLRRKARDSSNPEQARAAQQLRAIDKTLPPEDLYTLHAQSAQQGNSPFAIEQIKAELEARAVRDAAAKGTKQEQAEAKRVAKALRQEGEQGPRFALAEGEDVTDWAARKNVVLHGNSVLSDIRSILGTGIRRGSHFGTQAIEEGFVLAFPKETLSAIEKSYRPGEFVGRAGKPSALLVNPDYWEPGRIDHKAEAVRLGSEYGIPVYRFEYQERPTSEAYVVRETLYNPPSAEARFSLPTDDQGRKRFDIPDESWYEKLVTAGANAEERVETVESKLGRKPHEGVTYKIDTSRGLAKQDVEHVQQTVLLPIAKAVAKGQIPTGQSTLGDNGKPSLGDFMRYLAAPARNAHLAGNEFTDQATGKVIKFGTEANPPSGADSLGQPITTAYANARLEQAFKSEAGPQYRQIAELVREGNAWKLDRLVESGVQSPEWRDNVVAAYGEYWSSFADEEGGSTSPTSRSFQVSGSQYSAAQGRTNMGGDPFQLWLRDLASVISRTRNNAVGIEVGKLLEKYPELGRLLPRGETRRGMMERVAKINEELDLLPANDPAGDRLRIERGDLMAKLNGPTIEERRSSQVYKWRENGQDVHAILADPLMAKALHGVEIDQLPVFFRWVGPYSRVFRKLAAGYNPEFALGNAPRDVGYAWSKLYLQHGSKIANGAVSRIPTAAKALYQVERGLPATPATQTYHHYIAEARANGADVGMVSFEEVEQEIGALRADAVGTEKLENFISVKAPEAFKRVGRITLAFNGLVEAMTRAAVYVEMRESGHSVEESVSAWRRTTIDWAKRGRWSSTWLSFFKAFMPAGLKGTHNFVATIRSVPRHRVAKLAGGLFAAGYAAGVMSRALSDEWDDESEWSKARRMTVKVGSLTVGLALPWGFNLFYYGGILASDVLHGDKTAAQATVDMAGAVIDTFDPLGTPPSTSETRRGMDELLRSAVIAVSPQVTTPLAEVAVNKTFTGGPVYPDSPYMADHERKWRDTAGWAVAFAEFVNRAGGGTKSTEGSGVSSMSPAAIEHIIKGNLPGVGGLIEDSVFTGTKLLKGEWSELTWNRTPFFRKFIRETPSSASAQKYAVASRLIEDAVGRIKDFEPREGDYGVAAYADAKRRIDEYLAQKRKELDVATDAKHRQAIEAEMKWLREQLTRRIKEATKPK